MSIRRAFYLWLLPAAIVLPLWLLIGWGVFHAGGWAFLWVLFIAIPSVLLGQLLFAMLVRARPSARSERAVSWWDVAGFGLWNGLTIALGFYPEAWFALLLVAAIVVGLGMIPLLFWQLWSEAQGSISTLRTGWDARLEPSEGFAGEREVYVVQESPPRTR